MDWTQIQTALVSVLVGVIAWAINRFLGLKMNDETRKAATWAAEQGVAYAALKLQGALGAQKHEKALQVAESLAPKAMAKLDDKQKLILVDSTYAKMRSSLPHASTYRLGTDDIIGDPPS